MGCQARKRIKRRSNVLWPQKNRISRLQRLVLLRSVRRIKTFSSRSKRYWGGSNVTLAYAIMVGLLAVCSYPVVKVSLKAVESEPEFKQTPTRNGANRPPAQSHEPIKTAAPYISPLERPYTPHRQRNIQEVAYRVWNGEFGDGNMRMIKLSQHGYDPIAVQREVNRIAKDRGR
ncbi:hypothetical protein [Salinicoccus roseus]|uniref:hypothetical protein n=1 Tax=Salinicoccus roseus TaxID=45670 RepID=UPI003A5C8266